MASRSFGSLVCVLSVALCNCKKHPEAMGGSGKPPAIPAKILTVSAGDYPAVEEVLGTVRPKLRARIESKLSGRIEQMLVAPGQSVKQGELLVQLSVQEIQAQVDQAKAVLEQADRDVQRLSGLVAQKAVSQQEFEAAESRQRVARASLAAAETMLGYSRITAPFDGIITRKMADVGDLAMPGKPLAELEAPGSLRFEADIPEAIIDRLKTGSKLAVRLTNLPDALEGTVSEIAPVADPMSRTYLVKLDLPSAEGLRAGQFGRVAVPVGAGSLLRVPAAAVLRRGQMEIAFVSENKTAKLRIVRTGKVSGNQVEILSGLTAGESIVADPPANLLDGAPLQ